MTYAQQQLYYTQYKQYIQKNSLDGTSSPSITEDNETFQRSLLAAQLANKKLNGKKAGTDAPPVNIGWDSHNPVVSSFVCVLCCPILCRLLE